MTRTLPKINSVDEARDVLRKYLAYQGSGLFDFMVDGGSLCVLKNAAGRREVRWCSRVIGGLAVDSLAGLPIPVLEALMAGGYVVEKSAQVSAGGTRTVPALGLADSLLSPGVVAYRARLATLFPAPGDPA